ncbi:response regulator [Cellulosilyticum sp. I15G10I2]|uniref:response regulator n=1 Tax=Cellulosilyticum sp. I15G10I2 TaxID=1892843 RepID=UPI00085BB5CD|nr:response regulator [Cellulosilyticum sp. I15G10I2]
MTHKRLKVLLVDDEQNTRNLLRLCIDWESLDMEVIADATSGIEALNIIEEVKPDIVLTDIEMPYMDGITLSKQIMEHYIDISVVIITAHEQFTYAQQAVSIGVSDFILKPIDADIITTTLKKLSDKIVEKRQKLIQQEISFKYIKDNTLELRNKFLYGLINGNLSDMDLFNHLEVTKALLNQEAYPVQLAVIKVLFDNNKYTDAKRRRILHNCIIYIEETFTMIENLYAFLDAHHQIVVICSEKNTYLPELSERITAYLKSNLSTTVYCGIGTVATHTGEIAYSYQYAKNALKLCYILDEEIVYNHNFENLNTHYNRSSDNPLDHLILLVKSGLSTQASEAACELLHDSLQDSLTDLSAIKYQAISILTQVKEALIHTGVSATSLNFNDLSYSHLISVKLYTDIEKYVINTISEFCQLMYNENGNRLNDTISQIIHYLEEHYSDEDLSLTSLAKVFFINPSYLSRIFKKATHKSFTEYLVELRVQKAINLLQLTNYKAYQLAQMVGIPDPNYFIKCFRKVTGVSLQEFKTQLS